MVNSSYIIEIMYNLSFQIYIYIYYNNILGKALLVKSQHICDEIGIPTKSTHAYEFTIHIIKFLRK